MNNLNIMEFKKLDEAGIKQLKLQVKGFDRVIEADFEEDASIDYCLKAIGLKFLQKGYEYILNVLGEDALLGMKNIVRIKKTGRHATEGVYINMNISDIEKAEREPSNQQNIELQQSLIVHEVLHHLVEEEHLPMFLEMIYMIEKGQSWRIENIKSLFQNGRLGNPYIKGLRSISDWLGYLDIEKMLNDMPNIDISKLKAIFKMRYEEYCEEDPVLSQQIAGFKERIKLAA